MKYFVVCMVFLLASCGAPPTKTILPYAEEAKALTTYADKQAWLSEIFIADQYASKNEKTALEYYGNQSPKYKAALAKASETYYTNSQKAISYLRIHGYPTKDKYDSIASETIVYAMYHSEQIDLKKEALPYILEAYNNGDIKEQIFLKYLHSVYKLDHGKSITIASPFTTQDEIAALLKEYQ